MNPLAASAASNPGLDFKPFEAPLLDDPYPFYARLRREAPVTYAPALQLWLISRHADVMAALKDPRRFSSRDALRPPLEIPPALRAVLTEAGYTADYPLLGDDPPAHTRIRALVSKAFASPAVQRMEPRIREIARGYVDRLERGGSGADIVAGLAYPLPMQIISELLGIPEADRDQLKAWCEDEKLFFVPHLPDEALRRSVEGVAAFRRYLRSMIEERRQRPREDFLTSLIEARHEDERPLSQEELINLASVFVFAGHETTTNLVGNLLLHLLRHPDLWQQLRARPASIPGAVEEALRFDAPVLGMMRTATEPVVLSGTQVPAGARLLLLFGAANRDEAVFEQAERFDIHRTGQARHFGFGHGAHYCIGAQLARLEVRIALELLLERFAHLRLVPGERVDYLPNLLHRGPRRLMVQWDAPSAA